MAVVIVPDSKLKVILDGCIKHERASLKDLYAAYYGFGFNVCKRYLRSEEITLEATHDGFIKIYNGLPDFKRPEVHIEKGLKPWMRKIFARTGIDHLRRSKSEEWSTLSETMIEEIQLVNNELAESRYSFKQLLELVGTLSPVYRSVFNLYVMDGFSHAEIAGMLGISESSSRSNLAKARANLQKWLKAENFQNKEYGRTAV